MNKKLIAPLVVLLIIIAGVFYFKTEIATDSTNTNATSTVATSTMYTGEPALTWPTEKQIAKGILTYSTTTGLIPFNSLTGYEKMLVNRYVEKNPQVYSSILSNLNNDEVQAKDNIMLRYYDKDTVVFSIPTGKGANILEIDNIDTLDRMSKVDFETFGYHVETNNYIVIVDGESKFMYYKTGAKEFATVANSKLNIAKETYVKVGGFYNEAEFTFNESTMTVNASVFKPVFKQDVENPKIRTATYVIE